jgi:hypothetical protein
MLSIAQERARVRGREAVFQVGLGAQFGEFPLGKLAAQKEAETFAKDHAAAAARHAGGGGTGEIEEKKGALAPRESLDEEFHAGIGGALDRDNAAREVARAVPGLQGEARSAQFHRNVVAGEEKEFFARLQERGLFRIAEESLDGGAGLFGAAAGVARKQCQTGL